jgi:hypothetical protein
VSEHPEPTYDDAEPVVARQLTEDAGDPRIAAAVARLDGLSDRPPVEHVEVYEDVHRVLQDSLADATREDGDAQP